MHKPPTTDEPAPWAAGPDSGRSRPAHSPARKETLVPRRTTSALVALFVLAVLLVAATPAAAGRAAIAVSPRYGPPTTAVSVSGTGFEPLLHRKRRPLLPGRGQRRGLRGVVGQQDLRPERLHRGPGVELPHRR